MRIWATPIHHADPQNANVKCSLAEIDLLLVKGNIFLLSTYYSAESCKKLLFSENNNFWLKRIIENNYRKLSAFDTLPRRFSSWGFHSDPR